MKRLWRRLIPLVHRRRLDEAQAAHEQYRARMVANEQGLTTKVANQREEIRLLNARVDQLNRLVTLLTDPPVNGELCGKIRCRDENEALALAARVEREEGVKCRPYKCRKCPLHPVSLTKFWHICAVDKKTDPEWARRRPAARRSSGTKVTEQTLERLRGRFQR